MSHIPEDAAISFRLLVTLRLTLLAMSLSGVTLAFLTALVGFKEEPTTQRFIDWTPDLDEKGVAGRNTWTTTWDWRADRVRSFLQGASLEHIAAAYPLPSTICDTEQLLTFEDPRVQIRARAGAVVKTLGIVASHVLLSDPVTRARKKKKVLGAE